MTLNELFGFNNRIKILEELVSNWDSFLTVDEISRMSDVPVEEVYKHLEQLDEIGIIKNNKQDHDMFKLNPDDKRAIFLSLIECDEVIRQNDFNLKTN